MTEVAQGVSSVDNHVNTIEQMIYKVIENQKIMMTAKGIENQITPDKQVDVSEEFLSELEKRDKEIQRLRTELEKLNQKLPIDIDYLLKEANSYYYAKKYDKAIERYDRILEQDLNDAKALNNKGIALDSLGRSQDAITYFDKALDIDPNDAYTLYNKGTSLGQLGSYEESITYFDKALAIDPDDAKALNNKDIALNKLGKIK